MKKFFLLLSFLLLYMNHFVEISFVPQENMYDVRNQYWQRPAMMSDTALRQKERKRNVMAPSAYLAATIIGPRRNINRGDRPA